MTNKKIYYSISEVSKILDINEHTIRFWDSKLPGLSKQSDKGKTRFFNQNHINKLSNLNNLLKNNDSLNLAYELISKNRSNNFFDNANKLDTKDSVSKNKHITKSKIRIITNNLRKLI